MFASFKSPDRCRGTQALVSDSPLGPFAPMTSSPLTPEHWECLDGTLFVDQGVGEDGVHNSESWMVFCHEWLQVQDGEMCAIRLSDDLRSTTGEPIVLFRASEAPWTHPAREVNYVTDGPFMHRTEMGELLMLWSSIGENGYAIGISRSESGTILGPWTHAEAPLFRENGGHGMVFRTFEGALRLAIHAPNRTPNERAVFFPLQERDGMLYIG
jgi:arabinan endo-1,5-alpha-L-arabinosidase